MAKPSPSYAGGPSSMPGGEAKIPHASGPKNQNRNNVVTNSIKTLKYSPCQKKKKSYEEISGIIQSFLGP